MNPSGEPDPAEDVSPDIVELPCGLYPGVESFSTEYGFSDYRNWIDEGNGDPMPAPIALYVQDTALGHPDQSAGATVPVSERVDPVLREVRLQGRLVDADRPLQQFICSGTIAADWDDEPLYRLIGAVQESFFVSQDGFSNWNICLGERLLPDARLRLLRVLGFSHIRLRFREDAAGGAGAEQPRHMIDQARRLGMESVSMDLVLDAHAPDETRARTGQLLKDALPERIQLRCGSDDCYRSMTRFLSELGYGNMGLDWFVRAGDSWLALREAGQLHWSVLGFTGAPVPDVIGVGPGTISAVCEFYGLHESRWERYREAIGAGRIPVVRGLELEPDDLLRREIMDMILAASRVPVRMVEEKWGIAFEVFFAPEVARLREFERRGMIDWSGDDIVIRVRRRSALVELCRIFHHRERLQEVRSGMICV